jgi:hypothetical protein
MNVEMRFLFEISLDRDGVGVHVVHNQHLLDWHRLTSDKAWAEVYNGGAELDTWLTGTPSKLEIVFRTTHDLKLELVAFEMVLTDWEVCDFEFDFFSFWYTSSFWCNRDILVDLSLPNEIKVELTTIL